MPEEDGLVVGFASWLATCDDLAQLGMESTLGQLPCIDVGAQRSEYSTLALAPIIDHDLIHHVGQRKLHRAHCAVRHDERARA